MKQTTDKPMCSFRFASAERKSKMEQIAAETNRTLSGAINQACDMFIKRHSKGRAK